MDNKHSFPLRLNRTFFFPSFPALFCAEGITFLRLPSPRDLLLTLVPFFDLQPKAGFFWSIAKQYPPTPGRFPPSSIKFLGSLPARAIRA